MAQQHPPFPDVAGQRGLATVGQLRGAGWTPAQIRHRRSTSWSMPYPRVVSPHRGPLSHDALLTAAALWAGEHAVLTGLVALGEHGVRTPPPQVATFLVPATARAREHDGARVVRTTRLPDPARREGPLAVAPAARALVDAACLERVPPAEQEALAIAILQRGLATPSGLDGELWQRPGAQVHRVRAGLEAFTGGAWSRPEAVLRRLWDQRPDLPVLLTNCRLVHARTGRFLACPDGWMPTMGAALQVHSRQHHQGIDDQGGDRWAATVEKDSVLVAVGARVLGVSPWTLHARPQSFLARVDELVALGPASPMPDVRVVERRG